MGRRVSLRAWPGGHRSRPAPDARRRAARVRARADGRAPTSRCRTLSGSHPKSFSLSLSLCCARATSSYATPIHLLTTTTPQTLAMKLCRVELDECCFRPKSPSRRTIATAIPSRAGSAGTSAWAPGSRSSPGARAASWSRRRSTSAAAGSSRDAHALVRENRAHCWIYARARYEGEGREDDEVVLGSTSRRRTAPDSTPDAKIRSNQGRAGWRRAPSRRTLAGDHRGEGSDVR